MRIALKYTALKTVAIALKTVVIALKLPLIPLCVQENSKGMRRGRLKREKKVTTCRREKRKENLHFCNFEDPERPQGSRGRKDEWEERQKEKGSSAT